MAMLDIGSTKQLFIDDYIIESLTNAKQGLNPAVKADHNPILRQERPWEGNVLDVGKVLFDEQDQVFKMWYNTGTVRVRTGVLGEPFMAKDKPIRSGPAWHVLDSEGGFTCFATSEDGIHWERPALGLVEFEGSKENNIIPTRADWPTAPAFLDEREQDPGKRFKGFKMIGGTQTMGMQYNLFFSPDGFNWTPYENNPVIDAPELGRWAGKFLGWDPIRETYAVTMEASFHRRGPYGRRLIGRAESPDLVHWSEPEIILVPDEDDFPDTDFYSMPVIFYEGVYIGLVWVFRTTNTTHHPELVFSRDGYRYQRNYRQPFIPRGGARAEFDSNNVHVQDIIVHGDRIFIYYFGSNYRAPGTFVELGDKAARYTGLATLPLDGFVSLDGGNGWVPTDTPEEELQHYSLWDYFMHISQGPASFSQMVTRPFSFSGSRLYLNLSCTPLVASPGFPEVRVEVLKPNFKKLPGFTFDDADPITESNLAHAVSWKGNSDVSRLAGQSIKLRFYFKNAKLYSFQFR